MRRAASCAAIASKRRTARWCTISSCPRITPLSRAAAYRRHHAREARLPAFAWEPQKGAFVGLMARGAAVDSVRWIEVDPVYVFHPANAYEKDGTCIAT